MKLGRSTKYPVKEGGWVVIAADLVLKMSCKKGINRTRDKRLKSVKNKFPIMVKMANVLYLKPKPKISQNVFMLQR